MHHSGTLFFAKMGARVARFLRGTPHPRNGIAGMGRATRPSSYMKREIHRFFLQWSSLHESFNISSKHAV
jgi:hypothetical protein